MFGNFVGAFFYYWLVVHWRASARLAMSGPGAATR
jgi:formate/nitrite transporter FocA (FNT family)